MGRKGLATAMDYIRRNPQIVEVILSGGDPLMAQDQYIAECIQQLNQIPHLNIVRFHTRLPVVIPERISPSFLRVIESATMPIVMVYHINHPNEITPQIKEGVAQLKRQGVTVLNQSVLLKNVNDNVDCLKGLSLSLFEAGILPYYVNLLDKVQGASHFWVPLAQAHALQKSLREQLPGYLVPKFVTEIPHRLSKTPFEFQEI
jgi:KamA family protein